MNQSDNPQAGTDTTKTEPARDALAELREQLAFASAHPFVPAPVRQALPLLMEVLDAQAAQIKELQAALDTVFGG